jgi:hypothetical protein
MSKIFDSLSYTKRSLSNNHFLPIWGLVGLFLGAMLIGNLPLLLYQLNILFNFINLPSLLLGLMRLPEQHYLFSPFNLFDLLLGLLPSLMCVLK